MFNSTACKLAYDFCETMNINFPYSVHYDIFDRVSIVIIYLCKYAKDNCHTVIVNIPISVNWL